MSSTWGPRVATATLHVEGVVVTSSSVQRVALAGELDIASVAQIESTLLGAVSPDLTTDLVVDLAAVTFMDSSALGALVHVNKALTAGGGTMRLANAGGAVLRVLELAGLLDVLRVDRPSHDDR